MSDTTPATPLCGIEQDIALETARRAHEGTSFSPDKRGRQEIEDYVQTLRHDWEHLAALAQQHGGLERVQEMFLAYRDAYRSAKLDHLRAKSRCVSWMIAGPANFPVERMNQRYATEHRRLEGVIRLREHWLQRMKDALVPPPPSQTVRSGDADALERLAEALRAAEARQKLMKAVNTAIRKDSGNDQNSLRTTLLDLGVPASEVEARLDPEAFGGMGFPSFELRNNSAEIRRLKIRLERVTQMKQMAVVRREGPLAVIEGDPPANRVRLFFPGRPSREVIESLKKGGFRWTPSLGCWQAYWRNATLQLAKELAGILTNPPQA